MGAGLEIKHGTPDGETREIHLISFFSHDMDTIFKVVKDGVERSRRD